MLIGVVSDTHNNFKNIEEIITLFNSEKVSLVIHAGDIANAKSLKQFSKLNSDLVGVYGNNDRSEIGIKEVAYENNFRFQEPPNLLNLCNRKIAVFHEPDPINEFLRKNVNIDIAIHGHTHRYRQEIVNDALVFNPGESAGMQTGKNAIGIIDLRTLNIKRIFF